MVPSEAVWVLFGVFIVSFFAEADEEAVFVV